MNENRMIDALSNYLSAQVVAVRLAQPGNPMTSCLRCARDLLSTANEALARGDLAAVAQPLREAITEWPHEGEAKAMTGELARLVKLGQVPNIAYWLGIATRRVGGSPIPASIPLTPCDHCPPLQQRLVAGQYLGQNA